MSAIVCSKCGQTGDSKCPHCRSIFADAPKTQEQAQCVHLWEFAPGAKSEVGCGHDSPQRKLTVYFVSTQPSVELTQKIWGALERIGDLSILEVDIDLV